MIFPIGQYAGATSDGSQEVRVGGRRRAVDPRGAERYAGLARLEQQPDRLVAELLDRGLLAQAPATGPETAGFAQGQWVVPVAVGLGDDPEAPERYAIGPADRVLARTREQEAP